MVRCKAPCPSAPGILLCVWLPSASSWRADPAGAPGSAVAQQHPPLRKQHTMCISQRGSTQAPSLWPLSTNNTQRSCNLMLGSTTKQNKKKAASNSPNTNFTFTGHVHAEVDAINGIHVDGARLHEHGCISLRALPSRWVRGLVLTPKVGFSLHYPPPQFSTICTPADQHLRCKWVDFLSINSYFLWVENFFFMKNVMPMDLVENSNISS